MELEKRDVLKRYYMSADWARKINNMTDEQIVIMWQQYKRTGRVKYE